MKDFQKEYLGPQQLPKNTDPYLFTTPEVEQQILLMQSESVSNVGAGQIVAMLLTAPLTTITASLQLSVKPHKHIFQEPISKSTQLTRTNTALTLQEKRKMQLMLRSGGERRPFTAPVYEGYQAVIRGLAKQGWKAFFKGLMFRSIYQLGAVYGFFQIGLFESSNIRGRETLDFGQNLFKLWFVQVIMSMSLNIFHIAQNRYILQNSISEFQVFRNASKVIRKIFSRREYNTGVFYHIANATMQTIVKFPAYLGIVSGNISPATVGVIYLAQVLTYPLNTAFRRLACQHTTIPGMIPIRYRNLRHALMLMRSEEGILGLYKGFGLHHLTMGLRIASIGYLMPLLQNSGLAE